LGDSCSRCAASRLSWVHLRLISSKFDVVHCTKLISVLYIHSWYHIACLSGYSYCWGEEVPTPMDTPPWKCKLFATLLMSSESQLSTYSHSHIYTLTPIGVIFPTSQCWNSWFSYSTYQAHTPQLLYSGFSSICLLINTSLATSVMVKYLGICTCRVKALYMLGDVNIHVINYASFSGITLYAIHHMIW
jgi:hypothetical protein